MISEAARNAPAPPPDQTTRRALLAKAGALAIPGLGHVYLGDFVRGGLVLLAVSLTVPCAAWLGLSAPPRYLLAITALGVAAAVAIYVWSATDAFRRAKRLPIGVAPTWGGPGVWVLYAVVGYVFVLAPSANYVRDNLLETFVVPTGSMTPTILPGDRILGDKRVGRRGGPKLWRGAVAVFIYPNDRTSLFIKRVIGLPGDRVDVDGHTLRVNGQDVSEGTGEGITTTAAPRGQRLAHERGDQGVYDVLWSAAPSDAAPGATATPPPAASSFVVPDGRVFVLGDNRTASLDSRSFGTVPLADIQAVARQIWFSAHPSDGVRWARIGHLLQ